MLKALDHFCPMSPWGCALRTREFLPLESQACVWMKSQALWALPEPQRSAHSASDMSWAPAGCPLLV